MKKYWLLLILPALLLIWWGTNLGEAEPQVHFAVVRRLTIRSTVNTNGKVEPAQWAAARAETAGIVRTVSVQRGQTVRAGQTLIALDTSAAQSELAAALARDEEAKAQNATLGRGGRAAARATIEDSINSAKAALDIAQRDYDSKQRLAAQQAATKLEVQQARDALTKAKLQLAAAEDQKRTLVSSSDKSVAEARVHDADAGVALARHQLAYSTVTAPLAGTVYEFDLKVGDYLQPGRLVALVGTLQRMKVSVYVDEPDLGRVADGMPVDITWDAQPGKHWWGRVDRMPTEVISLGTRTVGEVATIVNNPDQDLLPGVSVYATVISSVAQDAMAIPKSALRTLNGSAGVYLLKGRDLAWKAVTVGVSDVNDVQILSGLHIGEYVADRVIDPSDAEIRNGMRVRAVHD